MPKCTTTTSNGSQGTRVLIADRAPRALRAATIATLALIAQLLAADPAGAADRTPAQTGPPEPSATQAPAAPPSAIPAPVAAAAPSAAPANPRAVPGLRAPWDYLPRVGYLGDGLWFSLRVPHGTANGWHASASGRALETSVGNGGETVDLPLPLTGAIPGAVEFTKPGATRTVRLVQPGAGAGLSIDADGRLVSGQDPVVLVVDRTEADNDQRWSHLRLFGSEEALHCSLAIESPAVRAGDSAMLAGIASDQTVAVKGQNVLLMVPGADCLASWKHREFRQALAWMVSDLHCRGAVHVVLAPPLVPPLEGALATPLCDEMLDVARAYHCRTVDLSALEEERYWLLAPGVQGSTLNADGRARLVQLLAPWR